MTQTPALSRQTDRPASPGGPTAFQRGALLAGLLAYLGLLCAGLWVTTTLVPDHVSVRLFGRALSLSNIHAKVIGNAVVVLAILPGVLWLECLIVGWPRSSIRSLVTEPTASMKTDLAILVLGQAKLLDIVGRLMMLGASLVSGLWIREHLKALTGLSVEPEGLVLPAQVAIYFVVYSFFDYWTHRFDHSPWLWPLHRYHHAAEDFCIVTAGRQHPAVFAGLFFTNLPMVVLGASPAVLVYVNLLVNILGSLAHSRIDSDWGWFGRWVLQSPNHHRLHHKYDMSYPTGHFSMVPVWDRLFGTYGGEPNATMRIGVTRPYRHGLWVGPDLARDYWHFWRGLLTGRFQE